ncbi:hypothetical protein G4G93_20020 [Methylobacterium sp. DB0501]|uniref:hypothetical protein n=1 Tax=Methylobacterium sp. DB0501 TaxID=2709665 RepID=UPI0013E9A195|nr:hypothetical protein [Methylobacterium sp. DB0501]NGM36182.1 hypothetical protein [Methylobacterium sp. DB0501]
MTFTAYREASAIRALILDPSPISGPREPSRPLTLQQLQFGGEFLLWDARADVECRLAIQAVFTKPCAGTALRAERALLAACEKKGSPEHLATPLYDAAQLLPCD